MPIAPHFQIEHIHQLTMQIARAPEAIRLVQMETSEQLLNEIETDSLYPLDYIVYRITGYRVENTDQPMLLGSVLLGDVVSLIATISRTLDMPAEDKLNLQEAAQRFGVSSRTISRLRSEGLVFYWVVEPNGRRRLGSSAAALDAFKKKNYLRLSRASAFTRLTKEEKKEVIDFAMQLKGKKRTLSEVAAELSKESRRGHETIRLLLKQSKKTSSTFNQSSPLTRKDARKIEAEIKRGVSWKELQSRFNQSIDAMRKSILRLRSTRLKKLNITHVELDVFARDDAEDVILGAPAAQRVHPPVLLLDSLEFDRESAPMSVEETAAVSAMHLLRRRASNNIRSLGYSPSSNILDRIETDLRWAFLLQQQLIIEAMPSSLAVAVQHSGRPLHELPANRLVALVKHVIEIVGKTCATLDPSKGQTATRTPAAVLDRNLPLLGTQLKTFRAAAKFKSIEMNCPFHQVVPWDSLIPTKNIPEIAQESSIELARLVSLHFGWSGKPRTVQEVAQEVDKSSTWVSMQLRTWI